MKLQQSVKLDYFFALTDQIAVLQHSKFSVPSRRHGYTVDDNARALVFAIKAQPCWPGQPFLELERKLMSFLLLMQAENGKFHNLMDFSQRIIDSPFVGDHLGRAVWATGAVINSDLPDGVKAPARHIFDQAIPWAKESTSPRTKAYACLGLCERLHTDDKDPNLRANIASIADSLTELYDTNQGADWRWFENILSYDNARLPQALFSAYQCLGNSKYLDVAENTFRFLQAKTTIDEKFVPIGNHGWYHRGKERALYDQQPLEAGTMAETAVLAYKITKTEAYERALRQALGWFFGLNTKSVKVYDEATGGCHDAITETALNENQGSEAIISMLLAVTTFLEFL
jgi:hypothetical protein